MEYQVLFGAGEVVFKAPPQWQVQALYPQSWPEVACDLPQQVLAGVQGARRATLVVPDLTRPGPEVRLLPQLVAHLRAQGVGEIEGVIATGLHRPMSTEEIGLRYGPVDISWHNHQAGEAVAAGHLEGVPIALNPRVLQAGLLISTGLVEPHQYAGYSGGYKAVAIGCAGEATIGATHSPSFLNQPGVSLGRLQGNPFQRVIRAVAGQVGHRLCVNYVLDDRDRLLGLDWGEPGQVLERLSQRFRSYFFQPLEQGDFQVAVVGCPAPKSDNLYQASRAVSYLAMLEPCPLSPGATLILAAPCPEGGGQGTGEGRFLKLLHSGVPPAELAQQLLGRECLGGEQRAWIVARLLERFQLVVAGSTLDPSWLEQAGLGWAPDLQAAVDQAARRQPSARCLVVSDPFRCLPQLTG